MAERQSVRMSKITNNDLTRSGIGYFRPIAVPGNSGRQRFKWLRDELTELGHVIILRRLTVEHICTSYAIR